MQTIGWDGAVYCASRNDNAIHYVLSRSGFKYYGTRCLAAVNDPGDKTQAGSYFEEHF